MTIEVYLSLQALLLCRPRLDTQTVAAREWMIAIGHGFSEFT